MLPLSVLQNHNVFIIHPETALNHDLNILQKMTTRVWSGSHLTETVFNSTNNGQTCSMNLGLDEWKDVYRSTILRTVTNYAF